MLLLINISQQQLNLDAKHRFFAGLIQKLLSAFSLLGTANIGLNA